MRPSNEGDGLGPYLSFLNYSDSEEDVQETGDGTQQDYLVHTTPLLDFGRYFLTATIFTTGDAQGSEIENLLFIDKGTPEEVSLDGPFQNFGIVAGRFLMTGSSPVVLTAGVHTFTLTHQSTNLPKTYTIDRANFTLWRVA